MTIMNIRLGDIPKTTVAVERAKVRYMNSKGWPEHWRSAAINWALIEGATNTMYQEAMAALSDFNLELAETWRVNTFNLHLAEYRRATARLSRYVLSVGRPEVTEEVETGSLDENGNPLIETVIVQTAIEALVTTVEKTTVGEDGTETTETIPNPLIVQDDAERAAAQAVVDATPPAVVAWAS